MPKQSTFIFTGREVTGGSWSMSLLLLGVIFGERPRKYRCNPENIAATLSLQVFVYV